MSNLNPRVINQYSASNLIDSIKNALVKMGKNLDDMTIEDLAPVDFFHIRGHQSTEELAKNCELTSNKKILDVGCGIGGTARFLSSRYGCSVTCIDVIDEYVKTAAKLSELVKLNGKTEFKVGNGIELPFEDEKFDVLWTEHVQMNIKKKDKFYSEIYRVLRKGGKFVFHDVFKGKKEEVFYPAPWADDEAISFLMRVNEMDKLLKSFNFKISYWADKTEVSAEAFQKSAEKIKQEGLPPLSLGLLMGENTTEKIKNMARNLSEYRLTVIQCVCNK